MTACKKVFKESLQFWKSKYYLYLTGGRWLASKVVDKDIVSPHIQDFNNDEHFVSFQSCFLLHRILHMNANKQLIPVVVFHGLWNAFFSSLEFAYAWFLHGLEK